MKIIIKASVTDKRYKSGIPIALAIALEEVLREWYKDKEARVWEIRKARGKQ